MSHNEKKKLVYCIKNDLNLKLTELLIHICLCIYTSLKYELLELHTAVVNMKCIHLNIIGVKYFVTYMHFPYAIRYKIKKILKLEHSKQNNKQSFY